MKSATPPGNIHFYNGLLQREWYAGPGVIAAMTVTAAAGLLQTTGPQTANQKGEPANPWFHRRRSIQPIGDFHRGMRPGSDIVWTWLKIVKPAFVAITETNTSMEPDYPSDMISMMAELCPKADKI